MRRSALCVVSLVVACDSTPPAPPPPPLDDILVIDRAAVAAQNHALLPPGFTMPQETRCSTDPTRPYLAELATDPTNPKVPFHWAPVVPGPSSDAPTVKQPEFVLSGTIVKVEHSTDDVPFDHLFGYDTTWDIQADGAFSDLLFGEDLAGAMHTEIDSGLLPEAAFGWNVAIGDRAVVGGAWILDCGHPPYGAEIHPPTIIAFAREDATTTTSLAYANPFRETQLYNPDDTLTEDFGNDARYEDADSKGFPFHLIDEVLQVKAGQRDRFDAYDLLEPVRFTPLTWYVCAPRNKPAGATLDASWRTVARTGVTVDATPLADAGCVRFTATMSDSYVPFAAPHNAVAWSWDMLSAQASEAAGMQVDVRQKLIDLLGGTYPALAVDNPPLIDQCPPLAPRSDAALDTPTAAATGADDQPFPFYVRARVAWH